MGFVLSPFWRALAFVPSPEHGRLGRDLGGLTNETLRAPFGK